MKKDVFLKQQSFLSEKLRGKTVMVSGSTGLVGSAIVRYLADLNENYQAHIGIIALFRNEKKLKCVHSSLMGRDYFIPRYYAANEEMAFNDDVDYIIHAAGISGGSKMHLKDPIRIFDIGINGTRMLLDYAAGHACKGFVYSLAVAQ